VTPPAITIRLDEGEKGYRPGETISGEYDLVAMMPEEIKAVELSVLWHTEGKGDEDLAVHHFERAASDEGGWIDWRRPRRFQTELPNSPLSYNGVIIKIRWCVRVRAFLTRGREVVGETPLMLGSVPPAKAVSS